MKTTYLSILFSLFWLFLVQAQTNKVVEIGTDKHNKGGLKTISFQGTQSFKSNGEENEKEDYYFIQNDTVNSYSLLLPIYRENGFINCYSLSITKAKLSDLHLKSAKIHDLENDKSGNHEGWLLLINSKDLKNSIQHLSMADLDTSDDQFKLTTSISFVFQQKEEAKRFLNELKLLAKKKK